MFQKNVLRKFNKFLLKFKYLFIIENVYFRFINISLSEFVKDE